MQKPCGKIRIPFTPDRMSERSLEGRRQKAEGRRQKGEGRSQSAASGGSDVSRDVGTTLSLSSGGMLLSGVIGPAGDGTDRAIRAEFP
ncbi:MULTISPECIES: hypothetical protein [Enterobacteriaceae]|uniref:hypothetical protein n=1 Tax=Enterobacteriaceae TaxID=543 RepID=UPI000C7D01F7|nr:MULTISPECIES: hypothetical protein [Enterobacteriaceae]HCU4837359.1 hypothetical protein [Escherichia coli]ELG4822413.1 hypothetical protein [Klebsiella oxytoca]ELK5565727.1 hypothetical protein [Klebsiella oxytoca]ELM1668079.1 hypothetical protein [Klebsiella oxytoca]MDM4138269.1 hypothetical protein [Klebsiella oxytoca]